MSLLKLLPPPFLTVVLGFACASCERPNPTVQFVASPQPVALPAPSPKSGPTPSVLPKSSSAEISAVGIVEANTQNISLAAHFSGVVQEVRVIPGQRVEKGALLLKLDTRHLGATLARLQAEVPAREAEAEAAKARVVVAESQSNAAADLLKLLKNTGIGTVSAEEVSRRSHAAETAAGALDAARASVMAAEAAIKAAKAAVSQVETDMSQGSVLAPVKGTVLQVNTRVGEFVNAGANAEPWMVLGNLEPLYLRVAVEEQDVWRFSPASVSEGGVRGNPSLKVPLKFVRTEPCMVTARPGALGEVAMDRSELRVLQVVYAIEKTGVSLFVGQPLDVSIKPAASAAALEKPSVPPVAPLNP